jgi:phospholipid transport system substrate-binding protein
MPQGSNTLVGTTITRPNQQPINVQWVVASVGGTPKVVDVIAEGTSMRITQRSDYASYLGQHGDRIDALIAALHRQLDNSAS